MRILNRAEFLQMPPGTMYCKATEPWVFGELSVKWGTLEPNDFVMQTFGCVESSDPIEAVERFEAMANDGASYPIENDAGRDGLFEKEAVFLVMERDDLLQIRTVVDEAIRISDIGSS